MRRTTALATLISGLGIVSACGTSEEPIPTSSASGFSLQESAFSFENFAAGYADSAMTPALVARMYGAENVCTNKALPCTLTPSAGAWMNRVNGAMNGGRCEGFAVMSSLFFNGGLDAQTFGAPTAYQLKLNGNLALQQELAYWFGTQMAEVTAENTKKLNATDALRFLSEFLPKGREGGEFYRIGMVRKTKKTVTGGHALTPIGYEPAPTAGVYYVHVYDNNFPAQDRYITIDTNKNRWEYKGAANPNEPAAVYTGDDANKNYLYFAPVRTRLGTLPCKFCKSGSGKKYVVADGADVVAKGKNGSTGVKGGDINESGGSVVPSFTAETWSNSAPMTLIMDPGETSFEISGSESSTSATAQIAEFGPGYSVEAKNLSVGLGESDTFTVADGGANVAYVSTSGTAVSLSSAVETANGNVVQVEVRVPAGSTKATATVDKMTGAVQAQTEGAAGQDVTLIVTKVDAQTGETQTGTVTAQAGMTNTLQADTTTWMAGMPLEVKQDKGDGTMTVLRDGCYDGMQNGTESDQDCGGVCSTKCTLGQRCAANADCGTGACHALNGVCVASQCEDGAKNGGETDIDCGGATCGACALGKTCSASADCASAVCGNMKCVTSLCSDGAKDGDETDVDCGGSCATKCAEGKACGTTEDCASIPCVANVCDSGDRIVFVTDAGYVGSLGGLAGADAKCQTAAMAGGLFGTYKAFLSDSTANASARLAPAPGRYIGVDGVVIANNVAGFFSATHLSGIMRTELNAPIGAVEIWTGSSNAGTASGPNCQNWTNGTSAAQGFEGLATTTNNQWSSAYSQFCDRGAHLYCVRQ